MCGDRETQFQLKLKCTVLVTVVLMFQASELAEFTSKISLLEEAKKKKDDEATEWQQKVQH